MDSGIYVITSPSGRAYIGSSKQLKTRKTQHFYKLRKGIHPCSALQRAFVKYGEQLKFIVIQLCSVETLIENEQFWIDNANVLCKGRIYNSSSIAGRPEHTLEVRKKIADAARNRIVSDETKKKLSEVGKRRKHTDEDKEKILKHGVIGRKLTEEEINLLKRRRREVGFSSEGLERMRASKIGRKASLETRAKMSEAQRRRAPPSEETKRKLSLVKTGMKYKPTSVEGLAGHKEGAKKRKEAARLRREQEAVS